MRLPIRVMHPISLQVTPGEAWYPSVVLDFTADAELVVSAPAEKGEEIPVEVGDEVFVEIILPDGIRRFHTRVRKRGSAQGSLHLDWPSEATRIQRRDNVRVEVVLQVEVTLPRIGDQPKRRISGSTVDVSAGGVRLSLAEPLEEGMEIEMKLSIPEAGDEECAGRVVRWGEREGARDDRRYWVAVEFTAIAEAVRRDINKLVFDVQREQMRRGH